MCVCACVSAHTHAHECMCMVNIAMTITSINYYITFFYTMNTCTIMYAHEVTAPINTLCTRAINHSYKYVSHLTQNGQWPKSR